MNYLSAEQDGEGEKHEASTGAPRQRCSCEPTPPRPREGRGGVWRDHDGELARLCSPHPVPVGWRAGSHLEIKAFRYLILQIKVNNQKGIFKKI